MPEWEAASAKLTAREALEKIMSTVSGESGVLELEGEEAMNLARALGQAGGTLAGGLDEMPEELRALFEEQGINLDKATVLTIRKGDDHLRDPESRDAFLKKFLSRTAEEDDEFLDGQREVLIDGQYAGRYSYRELQENARETMREADQGKVPEEQGGMAVAIVWLVDQLILSSNLMRAQEKLVQEQRELMAEAQAQLIKYRDHMIIEHGVAPDDL